MTVSHIKYAIWEKPCQPRPIKHEAVFSHLYDAPHNASETCEWFPLNVQ